MLERKKVFALAVLASTAWTPVALASEFPAVIPLSSLDGVAGFRLDGAAGDGAGIVAGTGDVNGDGFGDFVVGAPSADPHGAASGSSYVVFGKASGFPASIDLSSVNGSNGFRLDGGAPFEISGYSVARADDVNGDGFADIIIGSSLSTYVAFGKATGFAVNIDLSSLNGKNGFRLDGASGRVVAGAGDVNGDGFADVMVGSWSAAPHGDKSGSTYVVFGKASSFEAAVDLSKLKGTDGFRLDGVAPRDYSGSSIAGAGDVNGDGFADVIIGAYGADPHGDYSGSSYVVFGKQSGFAATIDLSSLDGSNGFRVDGVRSVSESGRSVTGVGDVNGDGFDDLAVGALDNYSSGWTYVVFGRSSAFPATFDLASLDGTNGFRIDGAATGDLSGSSIDGAGDVNGDGFADVIIGAFYADPHGDKSGASYVVFGRASGFPATIGLSTLDGTNGFRLDGVAARDYSGGSVAGSGDVNGDGLADVIVGASGADSKGSESGSSYVVFGRAPDSARTRVGAAASQYISGGSFHDKLMGRSGNDVLEGRGGPDKLIGGINKDSASYLHSPSGVIASLSAPSSNTGDAAGDTYESIENLTGTRFSDELTGNFLPNTLTGGRGSDVLKGRAAADLFEFNAVSDGPPGAGHDKIADFDAGTAATSVDRIDVRAIDAKTGPANQAFTWIGTAAFTNTKGELRVEAAGTSAIIQGDVNGDGTADLEIDLLKFTDLSTLTAIDFRL